MKVNPLREDETEFAYPQEQRSTIKGLNIDGKDLTGDLNLNDFIDLKELNCSYNNLTQLDLTNCNQLERLDCSNNYLQELKLPSSGEKLIYLDISDNKFSGKNLSMFSNLPLQNLTKLWHLNVGNTDINGSLEYLPESVKEFSLNNSRNITIDFLQEAFKHLLLNENESYIVPCYGISQNLETGDYLLVMKYIKGGNLRQYLSKNKLAFKGRLRRLNYNTALAINICGGQRPKFQIEIPPLLKDLIEQLIEKEYNQAVVSISAVVSDPRKLTSKLLPTKEITQLLQDSGLIGLQIPSTSISANLNQLNLSENQSTEQQSLQIQPAYGTTGEAEVYQSAVSLFEVTATINSSQFLKEGFLVSSKARE
ncbi:3537_t:CDS:2 [Scutellospora calospora]|uniref:3537_t:CDS:1 n=1 Tax=Scutellospora calospora TaxID=85575 RepID=A0ACA9L8W6_9GLOM|nr:3537_t:CDS:2 [Scutellospora calospora]